MGVVQEVEAVRRCKGEVQMLNLSAKDLAWLTINAYHEARGESREGKVAVCHVVCNRMEKKKKSAKDVILEPSQFSWANGGARPPIKEYEALVECFAAAQECMLARAHGVTLGGADHYFADSIAPPGWSKKMTKVCKIGDHTFFKS